jgi:hypothetical protein
MNLVAANPSPPMLLGGGGATQAQTIFLRFFLKQSEVLNGNPVPVEGAYPFGMQSVDNSIEPDEIKLSVSILNKTQMEFWAKNYEKSEGKLCFFFFFFLIDRLIDSIL